MARRFNPRLVGAFVLAATALGVAASIWLGSNRVFQRKVRFVVVFSQDIAGLEVDSPVKFRGVPVGRVASILGIGTRALFLDGDTRRAIAEGPPAELRDHGPEPVRAFFAGGRGP